MKLVYIPSQAGKYKERRWWTRRIKICSPLTAPPPFFILNLGIMKNLSNVIVLWKDVIILFLEEVRQRQRQKQRQRWRQLIWQSMSLLLVATQSLLVEPLCETLQGKQKSIAPSMKHFEMVLLSSRQSSKAVLFTFLLSFTSSHDNVPVVCLSTLQQSFRDRVLFENVV